jgi:DNA-directed RNA polymerase specialized sigma24 family protein
VLHVCESLSTAEIAEVLGISRNAVKMRLSRAREQLRCALRDISGVEREEV